jgi:hypothetical protein
VAAVASETAGVATPQDLRGFDFCLTGDGDLSDLPGERSIREANIWRGCSRRVFQLFTLVGMGFGATVWHYPPPTPCSERASRSFPRRAEARGEQNRKCDSMRIIVRAQTLALHKEALSLTTAWECSVAVFHCGLALPDLSGSDSQVWARLSEELTAKFEHPRPRSGHYELGDRLDGKFEFRIFVRAVGDEAGSVVGVSTLDMINALKSKGSCWNDLTVIPSPSGAADANGGQPKAIGALIVKTGLAPASSADEPAAAAASAALQHVAGTVTTAVAPTSSDPASAVTGVAHVKAGVPVPAAAPEKQQRRQQEQQPSIDLAEDQERLRRELAEEEAAALRAQKECEALEAQLDASNAPRAVGPKELLLGHGRARVDPRAQKLKVLRHQAEVLQKQLDQTHLAIAGALETVDDEERRFARLVKAH